MISYSNDLGFLYVNKDYKEIAMLINRLIGDIIKKSNSILDIGSGNGLVAEYLEKWNHKKIVKMDPHGTREDIIKKDFLDNPFRDKEFDLVIMNGVYDYIKDKEKLLKELCRVSKCVYCTLTPKIPLIEIYVDRWAKYKEKDKDFLARARKYFTMNDITYKALPRFLKSRHLYRLFKLITPHRKYLLYPKR